MNKTEPDLLTSQIPGNDADTLLKGFLSSSEAFPDRPALEVEHCSLTYRQLRYKAASLAATLPHFNEKAPPPVAVLASRSATAFAGVLGALMSGRAYVPLNPGFPAERTRSMMIRSGATCLVVGEEAERQLGDLLAGLERPIIVVLPYRCDVTDLLSRWPRHVFLGSDDLKDPDEWSVQPVAADSIAYVLFTSGSTGIPKGVMVTRANVRAFLDGASARYEVRETDRLSQCFDLTFDLSVFDMFMAWERGACLCCPTSREVIAPGRFILESKLTMWFSVPSTALFMDRLSMLKPGRYPTLRWSLFCGEALPAEIARRWAAAAPNSILENLYGPTELTIACTVHRFELEQANVECEHGIVPIGEPLPGMEMLVVDEDLCEVAGGQTGELVGTGPQLALGYLDDAERTNAAFVKLPGRSARYYRTGDVVRRSSRGRPMTFVGRIDQQIKVNGFRVELGEVEAALREEGAVQTAVALGWPRSSASASGIVAFIEADGVDIQSLDTRVRARLPYYMVPREYRVLPALPRNANGKVDRNALSQYLELPK